MLDLTYPFNTENLFILLRKFIKYDVTIRIGGYRLSPRFTESTLAGRAVEYKLLFYKNLILDFRIDFRGDFRIPKCLGLVIEFATDSRFKKEFG